MKLPPYVSVKNKTTYRYSRAYPIKIRRRLSQCPVKYDRTLRLKVGCSEAELNKAVACGGLRKRRLLEKMFLHQKNTFHYLIENQNNNVIQLKTNQTRPTGQ